jgi:hypothetical protein
MTKKSEFNTASGVNVLEEKVWLFETKFLPYSNEAWFYLIDYVKSQTSLTISMKNLYIL